jgi:hypothetical protein
MKLALRPKRGLHVTRKLPGLQGEGPPGTTENDRIQSLAALGGGNRSGEGA